MDKYTKAVLTAIALALAVIAFKMPGGNALAMGEGCGSYANPCYVKAAEILGMDVHVTN